ncbi:ABC transporter substrate-binding protein [Tissierella sp. P1]|jgi:iron complex transport system substrate-binding protein|uniref:ABC transporter substrate-binding protein n=1 Tax=unclassified Tissierella TaxID=2638726 RepID=UPI000BA11E74|nr:ABC transporter substrate-binding protein [Tissierella sp. P1]OZV10384.1 ABC transporter substrate-binding protein [Tissierella sp. P1]
MKRQIIILLLAIVMLYSVAGCGRDIQQESSQTETNIDITNNESDEDIQSQVRTITDLGGNEVEIPAVTEIRHVVVITPPVTSVLLEVIPDTDMIAGLSPKAFVYSNEDVMEKLFPNYKDVETTFVGDDFSINTEALLALDPDIILYYGEIQKKGLENIGLPIINFFSPKLTDPKDVTVAWDNLLRQIFEVDDSESLEKEWEYFDTKVEEILAGQTEEPKRALWMFSNVSGSLVVAGSSSFDAYAESFFEKAGIVNVATGIEGTTEVDMEQIYEWSPDIIFVFHNVSAQRYLNNSIEGQDWSLLEAWKNQAIYDIPQTAYSWGAPCADSPLMPSWLISKAYPKLYSEEEFRTELVRYYERLHNVTLTEADMDSILSLRNIQ